MINENLLSYNYFLAGYNSYLIGVLTYILTSFILYTLAERAKIKNSWISFIPLAQLFLFPMLAKKEWYFGFLLLIPIVNIVFIIIWLWNIYEDNNYPGQLSLVVLANFIPFVSIIANLLTIAPLAAVAWDKSNSVGLRRK